MTKRMQFLIVGVASRSIFRVQSTFNPPRVDGTNNSRWGAANPNQEGAPFAPKGDITADCRAWLARVTFLFFVQIMATISGIQRSSVKRMLIGILIGMLIGMLTEYRHLLMIRLK